METRKRKMVMLVVASVLIAAVGLGAWLFFGGDTPSEVDLEATAAAVQGATTTTVEGATDTTSSPTTTSSPSTETAAPTASDVSGTWTVDTSVGEFTVSDDTTATFAGFRVDEVLTTVGATTAVGRTPSVTGTIEIEGTSLVGVDVVADLTGIKSDKSRREGAIQRALNTSAHPQATFSLTEPIELGSGAVEGEVVEVTAVGELTINGITKSIELPVRAQLIDGTILVTAATDLAFSEFEVTAPSAASVVSVEDIGVLELQLWLSR